MELDEYGKYLDGGAVTFWNAWDLIDLKRRSGENINAAPSSEEASWRGGRDEGDPNTRRMTEADVAQPGVAASSNVGHAKQPKAWESGWGKDGIRGFHISNLAHFN